MSLGNLDGHAEVQQAEIARARDEQIPRVWVSVDKPHVQNHCCEGLHAYADVFRLHQLLPPREGRAFDPLSGEDADGGVTPIDPRDDQAGDAATESLPQLLHGGGLVEVVELLPHRSRPGLRYSDEINLGGAEGRENEAHDPRKPFEYHHVAGNDFLQVWPLHFERILVALHSYAVNLAKARSGGGLPGHRGGLGTELLSQHTPHALQGELRHLIAEATQFRAHLRTQDVLPRCQGLPELDEGRTKRLQCKAEPPRVGHAVAGTAPPQDIEEDPEGYGQQLGGHLKSPGYQTATARRGCLQSHRQVLQSVSSCCVGCRCNRRNGIRRKGGGRSAGWGTSPAVLGGDPLGLLRPYESPQVPEREATVPLRQGS
mmetsp:Transcript_59861/g.129745  ORF Transcript_59861/g.129745 Transcript_59861/m.129745 type:complete len:372 (-) Transcript_59861:56-1171(-)